MKTQDSPYFVTLVEAVEKYAKEEGWEVTVLDANGDVTKEAANIETFIAQGKDLIFLDAIEPDAVVPSIDKAAEAGIGVINLDSGVSEEANDITTVYSDNRQNGRLVGLKYAEKWAIKRSRRSSSAVRKGTLPATNAARVSLPASWKASWACPKRKHGNSQKNLRKS